jgi:uncharacterized protein (DUF1810 family)
MKTTIELPDELATQAKRMARQQGTTLRELVVDGLRRELQKRTSAAPRVDFVFPTTNGDGLSPQVEASRLTSLAYDLPS